MPLQDAAARDHGAEASGDVRFSPGAVWLAKRPGSRAGNRIVQRIETRARKRGNGQWTFVHYLCARRLKWCTMEAWNRWVRAQGGAFSHVSPEHIVRSEAAL